MPDSGEQPQGDVPAGPRFPQKLRGAVPLLGMLVLVYDVVVIIAAGLVAYGVGAGGTVGSFTFLARAKLTLAFGALGGAMLSSRYVIYAIRHSAYDARRLPWQVLAPVHSAVLAGIGSAAVQGGLITISTSWQAAEPQYTLFLISFAFLVGFASEPFVKRLIMAAESLFGESGELNEGMGQK